MLPDEENTRFRPAVARDRPVAGTMVIIVAEIPALLQSPRKKVGGEITTRKICESTVLAQRRP